jgi:TPP-dependent pyruvate/acetoin dehydrogenase alpha subunit
MPSNGKPVGDGVKPQSKHRILPIDSQNSAKLTRSQLLSLLFGLKRIRIFEDALSKMSRQGRIVGGVYLGRGQEAIGVGTCFGLRMDDIVSPIHRDMGVFLLKGMPMRKLLCQILGRAAGPSRGKDSWSHTGDIDLNILASSSMLGSSVPIACGAAMARQMQGRDSVAVTYFGEGSTARGDIHEGMNMAAIYHLPVIFICENNYWAYSTPVSREMGDTRIARRASSYGMSGSSVDGNDVLAVVEEMTTAIDRARLGQGPTFIECRTYRMLGHSEHDNPTYVPKEELEEWVARDPISRFRQWLIDNERLTTDEEQRMQDQIEAEVADARRYAEAQPFPEGPSTLEGVYAP